MAKVGLVLFAKTTLEVMQKVLLTYGSKFSKFLLRKGAALWGQTSSLRLPWSLRELLAQFALASHVIPLRLIFEQLAET